MSHCKKVYLTLTVQESVKTWPASSVTLQVIVAVRRRRILENESRCIFRFLFFDFSATVRSCIFRGTGDG